MVVDQPLIVYPKDDEGEHASKDEMEALTEAWEQKHKKSRVGEKISLGDYLNKNITDN